jgi:nitrate reductase alpha subunit
MPFLVKLESSATALFLDAWCEHPISMATLDEKNNPEWKTVCFDEETGNITVPTGSIGFRWGEEGKWNIVPTDSKTGKDNSPAKTLLGDHDDVLKVGFPYFGGQTHETGYFEPSAGEDVLDRNIPVKYLDLNGEKVPVACVFDLLCANYGIAREGLGGDHVASGYEDNIPYTPKWQESITGVPADKVIQVAREFARMPMSPRASR